VRTPVDEFTEQLVVPASVTEYVIVAEPKAVASTLGVAGESVVSKAVVGAHVTVCVASVVVKLILGEVTEAYVESAAIVAVRVQVPAATKLITPVPETTVQTPVVELAYDFVPPPADAVDAKVGGVVTIV
jgi:hypothetical protein